MKDKRTFHQPQRAEPMNHYGHEYEAGHDDAEELWYYCEECECEECECEECECEECECEECECEGEDWDDEDDEDDDGDQDEEAGEYLDPLLVTPADAADLLAISVATLWQLVRRDRIRCVEFAASGFKRPIKRFRLEDLRDFCERELR
jgi:hypothetical protein